MHPLSPPDHALAEPQWQVLVLPDLAADTALADLVDQSRTVVGTFPDHLVPVPDPWLHAVVHQVATGPRSGDAAGHQALCDEIGRQLASVEPFTLTAGAVQVERDAVVLDLDGDLPGEPWDEMAARVADAIDPGHRLDAAGQLPPPPSLTLALRAHADDGADIQEQLRRRVRPSRAPLRVGAVYLVQASWDAAASTRTWLPGATRIPLGR